VTITKTIALDSPEEMMMLLNTLLAGESDILDADDVVSRVVWGTRHVTLHVEVAP